MGGRGRNAPPKKNIEYLFCPFFTLIIAFIGGGHLISRTSFRGGKLCLMYLCIYLFVYLLHYYYLCFVRKVLARTAKSKPKDTAAALREYDFASSSDDEDTAESEEVGSGMHMRDVTVETTPTSRLPGMSTYKLGYATSGSIAFKVQKDWL